MVQTDAVQTVTEILADRAYGPGIEISELRRLYPTSVRRVALLESLRQLETLGVVVWKKNRVWWIGPIPEDSRPLGIPAARIRRLERMTPRERVAAWFTTRERQRFH